MPVAAELMPLHALELLPDDHGSDAVRRDWRALADVGLPSQLEHKGLTNWPHVTLVSAPELRAEQEERAAALIGPLLPIRARISGLLLLGGRKITVARSVDLDDRVLGAVLALRDGVDGRRHPGWLPHITLARRLPREQVQHAVDVLGHEDVELSLTALRRWDPDNRSVTTLASV